MPRLQIGLKFATSNGKLCIVVIMGENYPQLCCPTLGKVGGGGVGVKFLLSKEILFIQQLPHEFSSLLGQNLIFLFWIRL